jgi:hypothetical protein
MYGGSSLSAKAGKADLRRFISPHPFLDGGSIPLDLPYFVSPILWVKALMTS